MKQLLPLLGLCAPFAVAALVLLRSRSAEGPATDERPLGARERRDVEEQLSNLRFFH